MADDSDYCVPCPCGGWLNYIYDELQPHTHYGSYKETDKTMSESNLTVSISVTYGDKSVDILREIRQDWPGYDAPSPKLLLQEVTDEVIAIIDEAQKPDLRP